MKRIFAVLLALVIVVSAFAACGGNKDDGETKAPAAAKVKVIDIDLTQEDYAFGVDKSQPELLEKVNAFIKKIMEDGTFDNVCNNYFGDGEPAPVTSAVFDASKDQLVVATNAAFEPFEYKIGDKFAGIDMEIAALLAKELGKELVISHMDFDAVCLSVSQGKADIAMAGLTVKPEREEYVTFSDTYYKASQKLIVKADNTAFDECKTADDVIAILNGLDNTSKIGVQTGTTGELFVKGDSEMGFDGFKASCVGFKNGSLAVQDLINGNIGYVVIDAAPAKCIVDAINAVA